MQREDAIFRLLSATGLYSPQAFIRDTTVSVNTTVQVQRAPNIRWLYALRTGHVYWGTDFPKPNFYNDSWVSTGLGNAIMYYRLAISSHATLNERWLPVRPHAKGLQTVKEKNSIS